MQVNERQSELVPTRKKLDISCPDLREGKILISQNSFFNLKKSKQFRVNLVIKGLPPTLCTKQDILHLSVLPGGQTM